MLGQIISSVKGELFGKLQQRGLQEEKADKAVGLAKDDITEVFGNEAANGNTSGILNLFNGKQDIGSSSIVNSIIRKYGGSLVAKLGLSSNVADKISQFAIPFIMSKINANTPSTGISKGDLVGMIGGNIKENIGKGLKGKLGGLFGH